MVTQGGRHATGAARPRDREVTAREAQQLHPAVGHEGVLPRAVSQERLGRAVDVPAVHLRDQPPPSRQPPPQISTTEEPAVVDDVDLEVVRPEPCVDALEAREGLER